MTDPKLLATTLAKFQSSLLRHIAGEYELLTQVGTLHAELVAAAEKSGPACPKCGSPKISDVSGMGFTEFQCKDCLEMFTPPA